MDKSQVIKEMVQKFINDEKMFTSVDIGNAIKKETLNMDIRNRDVRDWLKNNISSDSVFQDYVAEPIDINNGSGVATLYKPHWKDSEDYKDRDQKAFGPADIASVKSTIPSYAGGYSPIASAMYNVATKSASVNSPVSTSDVIDDSTSTSGHVQIVKKCKYKRRIQIPGTITKALGWLPGQKVDLDKIKVNTGKLRPGLTVWYDGRFSIPRNVVGFGQDPVNVILKDDAIYFEKA